MTQDLDAQRWSELVSLFEEIVELPEPQQQERLRVIGDSNPQLRQDLEDLLRADADADRALRPFDAALVTPVADPVETTFDPDPLNLVGRTVSHFQVVAPLAYGGMGVVYRAVDTQLKRAIALKFPLPAQVFDRSAKERFLHEARIAGALDHANLCGIYEGGETAEGQLFLAMPLYEGETLKARIAREGAVALPQVIEVTSQIALGLSVAHKAGIVHRDLKPANVMLLPDGTVKILDFGLAKAHDLTLTASRARLGTVAYMAPEQIRGESVDGRADLWSLGVVLYEMLTGVRPFAGEHEITLAHAILHTEPARPTALRAELPAAIEAVVQTLLRKQPAKRYQSADALLVDVKELGSGHPRPGRARRELSAPMRRNARALGAIGVLIAGGAAGGGWLLSRNRAPSAAQSYTVAVLPFDGSNDQDSGYLAVGLSDAIAGELARLESVVVPTYATALWHAGRQLSVPQIGDVLGAAAIVRGNARRIGERVTVELELIDVETEKRLWTHRYEVADTAVLDLQRSATRAIVDKLRVRLASAEKAQLARLPTTNVHAYDLYLRGRAVELGIFPQLTMRPDRERLRQAQSFYSRARELDPNFALARGRLAHVLMIGAAFDTTQARREQALLEAEMALRLQPKLLPAHLAIVDYWMDRGNDGAKATDQLKLGIAELPNRPELHIRLGYRYANAGRLQDAVAEFEQAARLDPGDPHVHFRGALVQLRMRRNDEAIRAFNRAIELAPDYHLVKMIKAHTYMRGLGRVDSAAAILSTIPADWDPTGQATFARYTVLRVQRRHEEALRMLDRARDGISRDGLIYHPTSLMRAEIYADMSDLPKARTYYEAARAVLEDSAAAHPRNASIRATLGLAYAGLNRKRDAIRAAHQAMELAPLAQRHPDATAFIGVAAEVLARTRSFDEAFERLELLFAMAAGREMTVPWLRLWPGFDPLRSDPRYQQLLDRYAGR